MNLKVTTDAISVLQFPGYVSFLTFQNFGILLIIATKNEYQIFVV